MDEFTKTNTFIVLVAYELSTPVKEYTDKTYIAARCHQNS